MGCWRKELAQTIRRPQGLKRNCSKANHKRPHLSFCLETLTCGTPGKQHAPCSSMDGGEQTCPPRPVVTPVLIRRESVLVALPSLQSCLDEGTESSWAARRALARDRAHEGGPRSVLSARPPRASLELVSPGGVPPSERRLDHSGLSLPRKLGGDGSARPVYPVQSRPSDRAAFS